MRYPCLFEFYSFSLKSCTRIKPSGAGLGMQIDRLLTLLTSQFDKLAKDSSTDATTTPLIQDCHATYFAG